jgi:membrane protease YdiL (CAAX protease family)
MEVNFFLWPFLLPLITLFIYCVWRKRSALQISGLILISGICIVGVYWPLITMDFFQPFNYVFVKFLLFVFVPVLFLKIVLKKQFRDIFISTGLQKKGLNNSLFLFFIFLPIMLLFSGVVSYLSGNIVQGSFDAGVFSFFESFTEEFFFRGLLFLVLTAYIDVRFAYVISITSFVLVHPQHLTSFFIVPTIVQGLLTLEIVRRSNNLIGAWFLHGANRVFLLLILPYLFG